MSRKNPVRILQSPLTGHIYALTDYREDGEGNIVAKTKHDVTDDVKRLLREAVEAEQTQPTCLCDMDIINAVGCICGAEKRREFLRERA